MKKYFSAPKNHGSIIQNAKQFKIVNMTYLSTKNFS